MRYPLSAARMLVGVTVSVCHRHRPYAVIGPYLDDHRLTTERRVNVLSLAFDRFFFFSIRAHKNLKERRNEKAYVRDITVPTDQRFPNRKAQTPTRFANMFAKNRNAFSFKTRVSTTHVDACKGGTLSK